MVTHFIIQEIDPKVDVDNMKEYDILNFGKDEGTKSLMNEILSSVPGIDEAMSFSQLIK
jgi:arsenite-transporting ATPase